MCFHGPKEQRSWLCAKGGAGSCLLPWAQACCPLGLGSGMHRRGHGSPSSQLHLGAQGLRHRGVILPVRLCPAHPTCPGPSGNKHLTQGEVWPSQEENISGAKTRQWQETPRTPEFWSTGGCPGPQPPATPLKAGTATTIITPAPRGLCLTQASPQKPGTTECGTAQLLLSPPSSHTADRLA